VSIKVDNFYDAYFSVSKAPDAEWKRIILRLWYKYGIKSTGSKAADTQKLHELELKEMEHETTVTSKFLTVTKGEQEKILKRKKDKKAELNPELYPNTTKGAEILGQQVFLAIQMKQGNDKLNSKKKRNNKV
jgi:hypothetical protein